MNINSSLIPHLEELKEIRQFEQNVLKDTNIPVIDISHWNSGNLYKDSIFSQYIMDTSLDASDYHYSYEYNSDIKHRVLRQLMGSSKNNFDCVFIQNATSAICCIADYLKKHEYHKICILEPAYFSAYACLASFGLNVCKEALILDGSGNIKIPYDNIIQKKYDVIWITLPIFSTGIYFSENQIAYIDKLRQRGILLVVDESAASPRCSLMPRLCSDENIISIFSPHKYLALNSIKFAAIICTPIVRRYFEDWIDVFIGALPISACIAIKHYLSPNYNLCLSIHDNYVNSNVQLIQKLCTAFPDNYYNGTASNYITICNKTIPFINSLDDIDMYDIMRKTHVSFTPGYINGFSKDWGFCYRINLTLDPHTLQISLGKLFDYFLY